MALRIRHDGTMWCAAHTEPEPGDTYIDDGLHYQMSVEAGVIVALPMPEHIENPQWWWAGNAPSNADRWALEQAERRMVVKLTEAERRFLDDVRAGRRLKHADRPEDKVRQRMRRAGLAVIAKNPRRWTITEAGRAALEHAEE